MFLPDQSDNGHMAKKTQTKETKIQLPTNEAAFHALIDKLIKRFNLPDRDHATVVVANNIRRLPIDQPWSTEEYLGGCVLKHMAYEVAGAVGSNVAHRHQVDDIVAALEVNGNDQQARDALEKAALDGSEYAKEKCDLLGFDLTPKAPTQPEETQQEISSDEVH